MTTVTLKIEPTFKQQAQKAAKDLGFSLSAAIKAFLRQLVNGQIDMGIRPRYHSGPEPGDLDFDNVEDAIAYFKKEFQKNKRTKHDNEVS